MEGQKQTVPRWLTWAGVIVGAAVGAPILMLALKGLGALLAIGVTLAVGATGLKVWPVISMKIENRKVRAVIEEAKQNPIETLQNVLIARTKEYQERNLAIAAADAAVLNWDDKVEDFKGKYPSKAKKYQDFGEASHLAVKRMKQKQEAAGRSLQELR